MSWTNHLGLLQSFYSTFAQGTKIKLKNHDVKIHIKAVNILIIKDT